MKYRPIAWLLVGAFSLSTIAMTASAVTASPEGRKNTALILGGAAAYSLVKKKNTQGLALGAASVVAYKRYKDAKEKRKVRRAYAAGYRTASYRSARAAGYRSTHRSGRHYHRRGGHRYVCYRRHA